MLVGVILVHLAKQNSRTRVSLIAHIVMVLYLLEKTLLLSAGVIPVLRRLLTSQVLHHM
ncbi:hypothetical protein D3C75_961000 [compost metagenome]